jgi:flavin reductase (DIM6/NTAB) family NADH-FMN oxidoreductase RutF
MFNKVNVEEMQFNVFNKLDKEWALVAVGDKEKNNAMTVSWGGMGVLWNKNVVTIYIRPTRYTDKFLKDNDYFTLSFFNEDKKNILKYCGRKSGKDVNKVNELNLTPIMLDNALSFLEADLVFTLKKIYVSKLEPENFLDPYIHKNYSSILKDYHNIYIGEILNVYKK